MSRWHKYWCLVNNARKQRDIHILRTKLTHAPPYHLAARKIIWQSSTQKSATSISVCMCFLMPSGWYASVLAVVEFESSFSLWESSQWESRKLWRHCLLSSVAEILFRRAPENLIFLCSYTEYTQWFEMMLWSGFTQINYMVYKSLTTNWLIFRISANPYTSKEILFISMSKQPFETPFGAFNSILSCSFPRTHYCTWLVRGRKCCPCAWDSLIQVNQMETTTSQSSVGDAVECINTTRVLDDCGWLDKRITFWHDTLR